MDVSAAFPSVARGCLLRKMRNTGVDECLASFADSSMCDRRVIMGVESHVRGQNGEEVEVTKGLSRVSPVSPALFALCIAEIHQVVEERVEDCRGISFVDGPLPPLLAPTPTPSSQSLAKRPGISRKAVYTPSRLTPIPHRSCHKRKWYY